MPDAEPRTLHDAFAATAARHGPRPFLAVLSDTAAAYGIPPGEITYAEAAAQVDALREAYGRAGYGTGHRVALLLENRPATVLHFLALNALGVSVVPVNPDYRAAEIEYLLEHAGPALCVAIPARQDDLRAAGTAPVVGPDDAPPSVRGAGATRPDGRTEAALLYTSGTTGRPKGCVLTNDYVLGCGHWYVGMGGLCALREGRERMMTPLPLFHMNALCCSLVAMILSGGCLIALDRFHPRAWWPSAREGRATCVHYLGVVPALLMKVPPSSEDREHEVRFGFGAGVPPALHAPFEARFGFPLVEVWAMTETGAGGAIVAQREPRHVGTACFGVPRREVEVRIEAEGGSEAEEGELLVRRAGPDPREGFFERYLHDPEATEAAWAGGWFHTGDAVRRGPDGALHFVDRLKNVIRRSGENVSAAEVEAVLREHPEVEDVGVAAVPDELRGDEVFACIVSSGLADRAAAERIAAWARERMAYYKAPGYVSFVETLPVTSTQKLQRGALRDLVRRCLEEGAHDLRDAKKRGA